MAEILIRRANSADAIAISLVARTSFKEAFYQDFQYKDDLLAYQERTFRVAKIRSSLAKPHNYFWLALVDELPVAYAKLKFPSPTTFSNRAPLAQLQKIYVLEDFLGQGIGRLLQDEVIKKAQQLTAQGLWLSVYQGNTQAVGFYEHYGLQKLATHQFKIGRVDFKFWVMQLKL
ncbi:MAG: GNAT family N-acetyltransferase [Bacteroidota bacterium]